MVGGGPWYACHVEPSGWLKGAKDALVIADKARVRRGINLRRPGGLTRVNLHALTGQGLDVVSDRTRTLIRGLPMDVDTVIVGS